MSDSEASVRPWSVPIPVADIPDSGRRVELSADEPTRTALAKAAGLLSLPRFDAAFDLTRKGRDGVHVIGWISATVEQTCVVSLEPLRNELEEQVDLIFAPKVDGMAQAGPATVLVPSESEDVPEALNSGVIDLGAVATEFLILGIDPYPRKPGAVFDSPLPPDAAGHPFAALASLKKGTPQ